MTDEQNDANADVNNEATEQETTANEPITMDAQSESSPEQSTEADAQGTAEPEVEENGVQKRINKITAQKYQLEREKKELAQKLAAIEAQKTVSTATSEIKAPELPADLYDEEAMRKYHIENQKYVSEVAQRNAQSVFENQQQTAAQQQQQLQHQKTVTKYAENAQRDGVSIEKLQIAEATLNQAGISPQLGQYLLNDPNGGKIVEFLHDNPEKMHEVLALDPVSAGIKVNAEIRAAALSKTPKVSNAPQPLDNIKGSGYKEIDDFEKNYPGAEFI